MGKLIVNREFLRQGVRAKLSPEQPLQEQEQGETRQSEDAGV